jgi:serine/threonine protein kinase
LGCILYGLVYGVTPFNHIRQQWAKISAITDPKHKIHLPLRTGSELVPSILIDVMRKCLQRDPKARPTVADLLKIPYLQTNISPIIPDIPSNILIKIKHSLSEDEWQQLTEVSLGYTFSFQIGLHNKIRKIHCNVHLIIFSFFYFRYLKKS